MEACRAAVRWPVAWSSSLGAAAAAGAAVVVVVSVSAVYTGVSWLVWRRVWDRRRDRKRQEAAHSIQQLRDRLQRHLPQPEEVDAIVQLALPGLIQKLKDGDLSPLQVLTAYQVKALEAHDKTNCLIEVLQEAEARAEELGKGPRDGLLYGVPISIKDDLPIKGYDSTLGCVEYVDKPATEDAAVLKVLRQQGAVPFVRTNLPQLALSYEPGNPIFGTVRNPHNLAHGPGGSSSGEAALLASGGSILGIGSDIGGSLRVPAHFTGLCTLKPTVQRMSNVGYLEEWGAEQMEWEAAYGPMARDVDGVVLALKALWDGCSLSCLDPQSVPMTFNTEVYESPRKLKIGFYADNGFFPIFAGCERAVTEAKAILEQNGHQVVPWTFPDMQRTGHMGPTLSMADGGVTTENLLRYDRVDPSIRPLLGPYIPRCVCWLMAHTLKYIMPQVAETARLSLGMQIVEYWKTVDEYKACSVRTNKAWMEAGLDAVICPPFPFAAPPLGNADLCLEAMSYAVPYNVVNFPAGVVPMTTVTDDDIYKLKDFPTKEKYHIKAKEAMVVAGGLPIGVMVVAARYRDETCLRLMKELEQGRNKKLK